MDIKAVQLDGPMYSSPAKATLNVDEDDPNAVGSILYYLYTQQIYLNKRIVHKPLEDVRHLISALRRGDKYDLPLFSRMARAQLGARVSASGGMALPQIVRAMHVKTASKSLSQCVTSSFERQQRFPAKVANSGP
jgi:hypothetical protein